MWESIKGNLWKGGLGFSNIFPAIGSVLGAAFTLKVIDISFPRFKKGKGG